MLKISGTKLMIIISWQCVTLKNSTASSNGQGHIAYLGLMHKGFQNNLAQIIISWICYHDCWLKGEGHSAHWVFLCSASYAWWGFWILWQEWSLLHVSLTHSKVILIVQRSRWQCKYKQFCVQLKTLLFMIGFWISYHKWVIWFVAV